MRRLLVRGLAALGAIYAVVVAALFCGQRSLVFPRSAPRGWPREGQRLEVSWSGGTVPLWWVPGGPTVVWFHGNAGQIAGTTAVADAFGKRGFGFAAVEYPGYAYATGEGPSEAALVAAAGVSLDALAARGVERPACVGHSMGTGVVAAVADRCGRIVLIAPYTSIPAVAGIEYPWLPTNWLVRDHLDTLSRAPGIRVPALVIHGTSDRVIPVSMGRAVAAAIPGAELTIREGRGHDDVLDDETWDRIAAFLR